MAFFVAFYSYKGGVGRSLALANVGYSLAARGKRVVLVDMDLEAPGLQDVPEFSLKGSGAKKGFLEYAASYRRTGKCPGIRQYLHECRTHPGTGKLWLMPSGSLGASYQDELGSIPWRKLHSRKGTEPFIEELRSALNQEIRPDYVLIDSRTGLSDIGGLSTHRLADMVVLVFNLTRSSLEGSVRTYRSFTSEGSRVHAVQLVASPIPPQAPDRDSLVERRLAQAAELMPLGTAYGRTVIRVDYSPAMVLAEELAVRRRDIYPAATRYEMLRESIQRANPEEVFLVLEQALELRSEGRLEEGLEYLRSFVEQHPDNTEGHLEMGNLLFEAGRAQDAISPFQRARDLAPDLALAHRRLGEALTAAGRGEDAIHALQKAEELGERSRELYVSLARAYAQKGETAKETEARRKAMLAILASVSLTGAETSDQPLTELRAEFVEVLSHRPPFGGFQAERFWDGIMESLSLPRAKKLKTLRSVLAGKMRPSEISGLSRLLQEEESRWEELLGPLSKELQRRLAQHGADPSDLQSLLQFRRGDRVDAALLGFVALDQGTPLDRRAALLEEAVQHDPDNPGLLERLGTTFGMLSDAAPSETKRTFLERALEHLTRSHQMRSSARSSYNLGLALVGLARISNQDEKTRMLRAACLKFQEAVQHNPAFYQAFNSWAIALGDLAWIGTEAERQQLWMEAAEKARRANQTKEGTGDYNLACAQAQMEQFDEAERNLIAALTHSPEKRAHAAEDPDLQPLWEARPRLRELVLGSSDLTGDTASQKRGTTFVTPSLPSSPRGGPS